MSSINLSGTDATLATRFQCPSHSCRRCAICGDGRYWRTPTSARVLTMPLGFALGQPRPRMFRTWPQRPSFNSCSPYLHILLSFSLVNESLPTVGSGFITTLVCGLGFWYLHWSGASSSSSYEEFAGGKNHIYLEI